MTMSATLQIVGSPIANQPNVCVLTVANSSGAGVNVTGIQPKVFPAGSPVTTTVVCASPGQSVAGTGGINQFSVQVPAGGTSVFTFNVVAMSGSVQTGQGQQGAQSYLLGADVIASDGSEFSPVLQAYSPAQPQFGRAPGSPPNVSSARGELQFNLPTNTVFSL